MTALSQAWTGITIVAAAVVALGVGWLVWKRALLDIQEKAMKVQADAITAYEDRVKQLEEEAERKNLEIEAMRQEIDELKKERLASRELAVAIVEAVAGSRICTGDPANCPERVHPTV